MTNHCSIPRTDTWSAGHLHRCLARAIVFKRCLGNPEKIRCYLERVAIERKPIAAIPNLRQLCLDALKAGRAP